MADYLETLMGRFNYVLNWCRATVEQLLYSLIIRFVRSYCWACAELLGWCRATEPSVGLVKSYK